MSRSVVVLRPEPGCRETVEGAHRLGLEVIASPLFKVVPVDWSLPQPAEFDAILAGSANAFRHGGQLLAPLRRLPVHAVGQRTADAARAAGFRVANVGHGGLQSLIDTEQLPARLLRLSGETRVDLRVPSGLTITDVVVYRADPRQLSNDAVKALRSGAVALLHSGEAALRLAAECDRCGIDRSGVTLATLAHRIAQAAGPGWAAVRVAPSVDDPALLAMAKDMCQ